MALHDDLLEQAEHLAKRERKKPKQASLRRAVSTAYYALFHLLIHEASRFLVAGARPELRRHVSRGFDHGQMRQASMAFSPPPPKTTTKGSKKKQLSGPPYVVAGIQLPVPVPQELSDVARTFVDLQLERHRADYDVGHFLKRSTVLASVTSTKDAFAQWKKVAGSDAANAYLVALLVRGRS